MELSQVRMVGEAVLLFITALGNLFLWFESDWFIGCPAYFALFISSLITVLSGAGKLPARFKSAGRTLAIFFIINFQENAVCNARNVFDDNYQGPSDPQTRLARAGVIFALVGAYAIFAERVLIPDVSGRTITSLVSRESILSIRGIAFLVGAVMLIICQFITWGVHDTCTPTSPVNATNPPKNVLPLTLALLLALGVITSDNELLDLGVFNTLFLGFDAYRLIFNNKEITRPGVSIQNNYEHIWKAQITLGFIGVFVIWVGQMIHCLQLNKGHDGLSIVQRALRPKTIAIAVLAFFGLAGGACVWARVPDGDTYPTFTQASLAWFVTILGLVVPLLSLAAALTNVRGLAYIAVFFALRVCVYPIAQLDGSSPITGYLRGGCVMILIVALLAPLLVLSEGLPLADNPDLYFQGPNKVPMAICVLLSAVSLLYWSEAAMQYHVLYWPVLMCSILFFFGASTGEASAYKTVLYFCYSVLTHGMLWPLDRGQFTGTSVNIAFVLVGWATIAFVNSLMPGGAFDCFHNDAQASGIVEDGISAPFVDHNTPHAVYVAPDAPPTTTKNAPTTDDGAEGSYITTD